MRTSVIWVCFIFLLGVSACTNSKDAKKALEAAGHTDITIHGYDLFGCSDDDFYHTKFTATNSSGKKISGTVCSGLLFKNSTIRY